ncbi:MAG: HAMP domain-containing histidine kinase [Actinobacteria bacterium]|nr:HAMP domain-containing histidine kinase [Actinomycetota bacterium]
MTWNEPALFIGGLFLVTLAGALLPIRLEGREDHVVLTISSAIDTALLGPRGLMLIWGAVALAAPLIIASHLLPWRRASGAAGAIRSIAWVVVTAVAVSLGFVGANFVYTALFDREYPVSLATTEGVLVAALVGVVAWIVTMSIRLLSQRAISRSFIAQGFDPFESPLIPYLLPLMAGFPLITAAVAMYRPAEPWPVLMILWWCFPIYAATVFELRRRRIAQELRRDVLATQRLAAIGEVSARIVHQSRHQVGLMGWSIHRLRGLVESGRADDVEAAQRELDALAGAKDRLGEMLASELLHERGPDLGGGGESGDDAATVNEALTVATLVEEVTAQLHAEAEREGVRLSVEIVSSSGRRPARRQLRDVVFNLVDNAIDAADSEVQLEVIDRGADGGIVITVVDDGPGVPDADADRVFEPFFTTKSDGTGMGLAIADALVGDLGGELVYERSATTTRFVVTVPPPSD